MRAAHLLPLLGATVLAPAHPAARAGAQAAVPPAETFVHESWTVQDGLPVNSVTALLQSRDGYIWIATFDGLARFDGVRFTVFNSTNASELPSNRILGMLEARDGALWLRTEQAQLVRFRAGAFTHFGPEHGLTSRVVTLYQDPTGTLWVGTDQGVGYVRGERFVPVAPEAIRGPVRSIVRRADGSVWVGTDAGELSRIDRATGVATRMWQVVSPVRRTIWTLYEDPGGVLWIGENSAIWRWRDTREPVPEQVLLAGETQRFLASARTGEVWALTATSVVRMGPRGPVRVLSQPPSLIPELLLADPEGQMLYVSGAALYRESQRIYSLAPASGDRSPDVPWITAVLPDREGSLWLGTGRNGLHRLKPAPFRVYSDVEGLSIRNVYAVYEDRSGALWVGTQGGAADRLTGDRITQLTRAAGYPLVVYAFLEDRAGRMWVGGGEEGIRVCAPRALRCAPPPSLHLASKYVRAIHEDAGGALWFGTEDALLRLVGDRWERLDAAVGAPTYAVRAFQPTRDGALWMGTNGGGLARYRDGRFTRVTAADGLPFDMVRSLYQDADGWLWVGTEGRGLARLDPREWGNGRRGGRIVGYRMKDGLFDEVIHQILEDDFGRLWMSTNRGIFWVARRELLDFAAGRTRRIHSTGYTERDGLRNREANGGSQPAGVKAHDGRLWFPTQDGVAVVDPAHIEGNRVPPNVVVEQVQHGGDDGRDLEIAYTALSFVAPANMRFRYRLDPYDPTWVDAGSRRTAFYTRVPPGRYTFRVIASNNDGVWNTQGAALELALAPHVWETGAFRLVVVLALGTLAAAAVGWRVRSLRERAHELARLVDERTAELREQQHRLAAQADQLQELDRAKSRFFSNVSHEFRTPLTLTIGPLEDLRARLARSRADGSRELDLALRNARRLLRLVNQVLDVAKLEAGQMKLRARRQDLVAFARGVAAAFAPVAERKRIALAVAEPAGALAVWFDGDALEKVLANLLSNAFKFTPEEGRVALAIAHHDGTVALRVSDSGPGIPAEHRPHVFERFYQVDESSSRAQPGTGIGLALVKELVELHGGAIAVESGIDGGASFVVTLPLGREHLRDDQVVVEPGWEMATSDVVPASVDAAVADPAEGILAPERGEDVTTVLIVEDHAELRAWVRAHFEPRYRVVEAADGAEGIARARALVPDIVISDVMMPGTDGWALCRALKGSAETDFIPIVLLTARATTDDRVTGLEGGADDYLVKPFEMRELEARVENLIASRRRLRERFSAARVDPTLASAPATRAPSSPDQAWVERLRAVVDEQLADPEFGVGELARALFMDRTHLFRRARELVGESPSDVIRRRRLERAASLLADGVDGVGEIAYGVGFNSVTYFCRSFREAYGATPTEYRHARAVLGAGSQPG